MGLHAIWTTWQPSNANGIALVLGLVFVMILMLACFRSSCLMGVLPCSPSQHFCFPRCIRGISDENEVFYSARSEFSVDLEERLLSQIDCEHLTSAENVAIHAFLKSLPQGVERPSPDLLLQTVWARKLDVPAACCLWQQHLKAIRKIGVDAVDDATVRSVYSQGFCVRCGKDVDGRPMLWIRMGVCDPRVLTPPIAVKNTWLAHDAVLSESVDVNRQGICFVYDLHDVGTAQVNLAMRAGWWKVNWVHAALWGGPSHPSHISRVWLVDAPVIFVKLWNNFNYFLPSYIRDVVRFHKTVEHDRGASLAHICTIDQLPVYLGGDDRLFGDDFAEWMFRRLEGKSLMYRR
eukprot:TRINITY_DN39022_c0_g1_i1.p1 TRINITY_DN39022_c0_g1~~TRINITY_DN39022_c0_g1_i1.p1  ORF type:complete len:348 (-),score=38.46 TRINITY_DN39022_c0_g1_i1:32-1075(-)